MMRRVQNVKSDKLAARVCYLSIRCLVIVLYRANGIPNPVLNLQQYTKTSRDFAVKGPFRAAQSHMDAEKIKYTFSHSPSMSELDEKNSIETPQSFLLDVEQL